VGQFRVAYKEGNAIHCMTASQDGTLLILGDSSGHVHIWDIDGWCEEGKTMHSMADPQEKLVNHRFFIRFPFLLSIAKLRWKMYDPHASSIPEHLAAFETLKVPLRLNCWLGHVAACVAVQYIDEKELVVSSSNFGTVRLWTVMGSFIGAFGQDVNLPWEIPEMVKAPSETKIESEADPVDSWGSLITLTDSQVELKAAAQKDKINDTRRHISAARKVGHELIKIASSLSLRVYNQGACPYWKYAKNIILIWCVRFAGHKVDESHKNVEVAKLGWDWPGVPARSDILGKTYRPIPRYKEPLDFNKLVSIDEGQVAVYHCVPLIPTSLNKEDRPDTPLCVKRHQAELARERKILGGAVAPVSKPKRTIKLPPI